MLGLGVPLPSAPVWSSNLATAAPSPARCLGAAGAGGAARGSPLPRPPPRVLAGVLPWEATWAGAASSSPAHSGRQDLLLLNSAVGQRFPTDP